HELLDQLELVDTWKRATKTLSGGQRRRLDIAMGLIHDPGLLFLDEPTTGLDPQARANLWEHVRDLRDVRGATVFLTTHYLEEADALCDRVLIIDGGRIVAEGAHDELRRRAGGDTITLTLADAENAAQAAERLAGIGQPMVEGCDVRLERPRHTRRSHACSPPSPMPASSSSASRCTARRSTMRSSSSRGAHCGMQRDGPP
ncbi:MAG: ATP-binding cassette domain-containing protein, partial [Gaiellales bacterium]